MDGQCLLLCTCKCCNTSLQTNFFDGLKFDCPSGNHLKRQILYYTVYLLLCTHIQLLASGISGDFTKIQ